MTAVDDQLAAWLERYGDDVLLGDVLSDGHDPDALALTYDGVDGVERLTYGELSERSRRLAGALRAAGIGEGDRVAVMLPKSPALLVAIVAILRAGAIHVPLFTAFGPEAARYRIEHSGARLVITDADNRAKVDVDGVPVMSVADDAAERRDGDLDFAEAVERGPSLEEAARSGDDLMFLLYTSGTTGHPKGVEVPVRSLASFHSYMHYGLDLRSDDVFWNIADPGWGYGLWFGIIGSMLVGQATLLRGKPFEADAVLESIVEHGVTNLTGAPTVYRALRAEGVPDGFRDRCRLRVVSSAGEPLNAELLDWSERTLGIPIHDHYGQSELGMTVGFPHHEGLRLDPVAGSMGIGLPGFRVVVVDDDGVEVAPDVDGELAIDVPASPLHWFRGYYEDPERTAERFRHGSRYYLTGDAARVGADGLLHFASRADDVITSSGYRIGPFEVESALMAHPAVAEVAVIGTPDELRGEAVTAFIVTGSPVEDADELVAELQGFVKARLAKHLYPRHIRFVEALPRTPSGKVKRTVLREQWHAQVGA